MPERALDERFHLNLEDIKEFAIFRVDPAGRIASWNAGAERVKGYTAAEAIGRAWMKHGPAFLKPGTRGCLLLEALSPLT